MRGRPIAEDIDALIAAPKAILGEPDWQQPFATELRLIMPLAINGVSCGADLKVTAFPLDGHSKYCVHICAPSSIWRVDYDLGATHTNNFERPADLEEMWIDGPHYHAWRDNRRFATHGALPLHLHNARMLPENLRSFDSALRWFCEQTNIEQPQNGLIDLPRRTRLL